MNYSGYSCRECGSTYSTARHLNSHEKERCVRSKRSLEDLLGQTKALWEARKRRRIANSTSHTTPAPRYPPPPSAASITNSDRDATFLVSATRGGTNVPPETEGNENAEPLAQMAVEDEPMAVEDEPPMAVEDEPPMAVEGEPLVQAALHNAPIAIRRTRRARKLPARFADNADPGSDNEEDEHPERLLPLDADSGPTPSAVACSSAITANRNLPPNVGRWWTSEPNRFSLWRCYYGLQLPSHDAERHTDFHGPNESPDDKAIAKSAQIPALGPFPNLSAFWFADWWWNGGNEKSNNELQKLLTLVTTEGFSFEDAFATDWKATIKVLDADEDEDDNDEDNSWFDDANWILTPITIPVSFHRLMKNSGTKHQTVGHLKHRRIISVIEEKIRNPPKRLGT
ncbi:hypothetical protein BKA70DRAFT_1241263 [Coprinopsis sp. MPI-PUGE-AT-0042]|nr:hypothetical protein BKA70DRAFT_1241263 [Coprinopsis sp. MPI-PUGE-AT-0042]